ncbi:MULTISPECIES: hypothetical protein [unclassified Devosia]|uniref:N-acyl amino acid synthase FeeM domain-containing protein n=1 Tax=unclassified Devosia TaxID=196773 RepID=UPI00155402BC|nr:MULTISPECIES: hypothetical protein [unclassified Devosia]
MSAVVTPVAGGTSRFAEALVDLLDRVEYRRVSVEDQLDPVYRLRYEAYRREEFIPFNSQQVVRDEFDELPNVSCFGVLIDGRLVSSIRVHHLSRDTPVSPSQSVFPDLLDPLIADGVHMVDPGRFTADHEATLAYPALPFLALRIGVMAARHYGARYCLSSVRPEHSAFYRRVFNSTQWGEARYYHGLRFPMVLMVADVPVIYPPLLERYPFFMSTEEERQALFGSPSGSVKLVAPSARMARRIAQLGGSDEGEL